MPLLRAPRSFPYAIAWCILLGVVVPGSLILLHKLYWRPGIYDPRYGLILEKLMLCLWPSSLILMAPRPGFSLAAISISINVVLYCFLGSMIWYGAAKHRAVLAVPATLIMALWILIWVL
jgi:hypothetical protein